MKNEELNKTVSIGEKIKTRRKILGFSQEELAYRMFTSKQMISAYEHDKVDIKVSVLHELANTLDVSVSWLLNGINDNDEADEDADLEEIKELYLKLPQNFRNVAKEQLRVLVVGIEK